MTKVIAFCLLAVAPLSTPAVANPVDNSVASLIQNADYGAAEAALTAKLRRTHDDASSLLNLAFLYKQTDRWQDADAVYARVLAASDRQVRTADGQLRSSHEIARAGMTGGQQYAAR